MSSWRAELIQLGDLAWAAASASAAAPSGGGRAPGSASVNDASSAGGGVDAKSATELLNRINTRYKTAADLDDLTTLMAGVAGQYKKLGGTKDKLIAAITAAYTPQAASTAPTPAAPSTSA